MKTWIKFPGGKQNIWGSQALVWEGEREPSSLLSGSELCLALALWQVILAFKYNRKCFWFIYET